MESGHEKRKVGRPRFLTDSAKKRIARERNRAAVFRTKVYLGDQYQRWMLKKEELGETHAGLAKILLDRFSTDSETESSSAQGAPPILSKHQLLSRNSGNVTFVPQMYQRFPQP